MFGKWLSLDGFSPGKKAAVVIALMAGLAAVYLLDIWLLGTAAYALHDLANWIGRQGLIDCLSHRGIQHAFDATARHWSHPATGQIYSNGITRKIWLYMNLFLALLTGCFGWKQSRNEKPEVKNNSNYVHGLKVVKNPALGLSHWAGINELTKFCEFGPPVTGGKAKYPGGNLIGKLNGRIVRVNFGKVPADMPRTAQNAIFYGGTGSGKTYSVVIPNIIAAVAEGQSIVVIDPKGEIFETVGNWLQAKGYQNVWALNFMTPEHSHRWNPVTECQDDAEISEMIDTLSTNATDDKELSYFMLKGMELAEAMIGLLKGDFPAEQQHLRSLITLASWPETKLDARFRAAYRDGKISPLIYERWRGVARQNYDYAVSNLTAVLKNLTTTSLSAMMSQHEIDLRQVGLKKTALFLIIPTGGEGVYLKPLLSIFYKFLFKRLDRLAFQSPGKRLPVNVRNIWDEMANVGKIPGLAEIISTSRSKGIHIQMILQTPSQLESVYGKEDAETITGNCPTVMLVGIAPADTVLARMFSRLLGTAAVETERVSKDLTNPVQRWFDPQKRIRTVTEMPLMSPDAIFRIDPRYGIALLQWSYPLYLRKVGWTELPQAKEIKQCGMLPVERVIGARTAEVELPAIEPASKKRSEPEGQEPATHLSQAAEGGEAVVPW